MIQRDPPTLPLISVLLPTTQPWPTVAVSLSSLLAQTDAPAFEILLLDGHGRGFDESQLADNVRYIPVPGADTFQLRAAGIEMARGAIVAVTEDHCIAPPDWISAISKAHEADGSIALLGPTANHPESSTAPLDRVNFVLTFAGQNAVRIDLDARHLPVPTNLSFKRNALPERIGSGDFEYRWLQELKKRGEISVARAVLLQHKQSWGIAAPRVHFASGRSFGASVRQASSTCQLKWWTQFPSLPFRVLILAIPDLARGAGGLRATLVDYLCLLLLVAVNVAGQGVGAAIGPGLSRQRL